MTEGMARKLDAWCETCQEVRVHVVQDPGSCKCSKCGSVQQMFAPLRET